MVSPIPSPIYYLNYMQMLTVMQDFEAPPLTKIPKVEQSRLVEKILGKIVKNDKLSL